MLYLSRNASLSKWLFFLIVSATVSAWGEEPPPFVTMWGSPGTGPGEFQSCADIAGGGSGVLYVADYENARIQRFQDDGMFVDEWPTQPVDGTAVFPRSIAVDADENVFVVAQALDRIQKYTSDGDLLVTWGGTGSSDGEFHWPSGIAIGPDGHVYVADSNNSRIQEFSSSGVHLRTLGPLSTPPATLGLVGGVAVDAFGNIFSSDLNGDRIVKLSPAGATLLQWGMKGSADGSFDSPGDLSIDPAGNVYVVEQVFPPFQPSNHRVQKFTNDGVFLSRWGEPGTAAGQFEDPHGITVDPAGFVYVADTQNNRIQKFGPDATVAVVLSDFEVMSQEAGVEIRWRARLSADASFEVWRADTPGTWFESLGEIVGHRDETTFSFLDTSARSQSVYWYKLGVRQGSGTTFTQEMRVETVAATDIRLAAGPNPSRAGVRVDYAIPHDAPLRLEVFDVSGAKIRTLVNRTSSRGTGSAWWDRLDEGGRPVAAGRYFVRLETPGTSRTCSIVLLR
jgi:DNA-binding beta-propeller fold protein YncE